MKVFLDKRFFNIVSLFLCVLILVSVLIVLLYFIVYKSFNIIFEINFEKFLVLIKWFKGIIIENLLYFFIIYDGVSKFLENFSVVFIMGYLLKISSYVGRYSLKFIIDVLFILGLLFFFFYYGERFYCYFLGVLLFGMN